jgi:prepilin peptidase CpaA
VAAESHKVTVSEAGGGACLAAAIMLQSGPWIFASFAFVRIFAPTLVPTFIPWIPALLVAICAGVLDWRYRRIPNWLTVSGLGAGIAINTILYRWAGAKDAVLGAALGLGLLLPFVLVRSLGAGDWKLAGALGACLGWRQMLSVLIGTILVAGIMALAVVIWKGRLKQTLFNIAHLLAALFTLRMPGAGMSIDDPQSTKIPFGVAMALTVLICGLGKALG